MKLHKAKLLDCITKSSGSWLQISSNKDKLRNMILQENDHRIAFARIVSDLIEADFIIEASEIKKLEELKAKFGISQYIFKESRKRTFAWAVEILCQLEEGVKEEVRKTLISLALSDGTCVPLEALLIMSFCSAMDGKGKVFSIPLENNYVDNMKVIYVEKDEETLQSKDINKHKRAIQNEFRLAGFDFVHIPQIAEDYSNMDPEYLEKAISYMIPSLEKEKVKSIKEELCSMTTSRFCRDILYGKMGMSFSETKPSFLVKIGESFVIKNAEDDVRTQYSNYLQIELEADPVKQVINLMDTYKSLVSSFSIMEIHPQGQKFVYHGFHRSLFDLVAFCKVKNEYDLIVDLDAEDKKERMYFQFKDSKIYLPTGAKPRALYLLMIHLSLFENGLDWRENISKEEGDSRLAKFSIIYSVLGGGERPIFKDVPAISKFVKDLEKFRPSILNIDSFIPIHKKGKNLSIYHVPVPANRILVKKCNDRKPMLESVPWKKLFNNIAPSDLSQ